MKSLSAKVRELENVVARAVALSAQPIIPADTIQLPQTQPAGDGESFKAQKARAMQTFERQYLQQILHSHGANFSKAARAAGMDRGAFWRLVRKNGLTPTASASSRS